MNAVVRDYPHDNSGSLFDDLKSKYDLQSDAALARLIDTHPPEISLIRQGLRNVSDELILRIHERLCMPVVLIRAAISRRKT